MPMSENRASRTFTISGSPVFSRVIVVGCASIAIVRNGVCGGLCVLTACLCMGGEIQITNKGGEHIARRLLLTRLSVFSQQQNTNLRPAHTINLRRTHTRIRSARLAGPGSAWRPATPYAA